MNVLSTVALNGPNIWSRLPALEARVNFSGWEQRATNTGSEFAQRLRDWLPSLILSSDAHVSAASAPAEGAAPRSAAQALLDLTLALHALSCRPLEFGQVIETDEPASYLLVMEYEEAALTRACLDFAVELCAAAAHRAAVDVESGLQRLNDLAYDSCLGVTIDALVAVARQRGIPVRRLDSQTLVQFGHGARQRRSEGNIVDCTGMIAGAISVDKDLTKSLLREIGVPVAEGLVAADRDDAWRAACQVGLPVVVKPRTGDYQLGVKLNLRQREDIVAAYDAARRHRDEVLVERFVPGAQYRVTVVGHRVVAAIRRVSPEVRGDGVHTVAELIDEANRLDPRRGEEGTFPLDKIRPDDDTPQFLAEQGLSLTAVPAAGQVVVLTRFARSVDGGEVRDVTDELHPDVAAHCVRAARMIGVDVAGLDLITTDISRPLEETGGAVLEVNEGPCLALHFTPFCDRPRPLCEAIMELLFPAGQTGRIPVAVIAGDGAPTGRLLEALWSPCGPGLGRTSPEGLHVDGRRIKSSDSANAAGARGLFLCPDVERAILEQSCARIRAEGLVVDRCDLAILADIGSSAVPGSRQAAELERAAKVLVEALGPEGTLVLDAGQSGSFPPAFAHAGKCTIVTSAGEPSTGPTRSGRVEVRYVYRRGSELVLRSEEQGEQFLPWPPSWLDREPEPAAGERALLQAVAGAWALGVPLEELRAGVAALPTAPA